MTNGVELLVIEMVAGFLAAEGEKLINQMRHREQRRTPIESIPLVFKRTHFVTGVLACFKNIHGIPLLGQPNGCGDARDSRSNNNGSFRHTKSTTRKHDWFLPAVEYFETFSGRYYGFYQFL